MIPEEDLEHEADRLYPFFRERLHTNIELRELARKLEPHNDEIKAIEVGQFVVGQAKRVLQVAVRALGYFLLAALAFAASIFSLKWFR